MKNYKKKVAVIMSVYKSDAACSLKTAINSILNQTYPCDLFIFIDGVIPVELQIVINEFNDSFYNVKLFRGKENRGLANALNQLISVVINGDYEFVARMDSDDISRSRRIEKQVQYFNDHLHVDVCGTSCREFGASYALEQKHLPKTHEELLIFSIARCPFIHPSVMFRSSVFIDGNRYPTNTSLTEDMALWFELLNKGYRFGNINDILLDYRLNEMTIKRRKGFAKALSELRIRLIYMLALKQFSLRNFILICSRLIFHLMPSSLVKIAYKKAR